MSDSDVIHFDQSVKMKKLKKLKKGIIFLGICDQIEVQRATSHKSIV
jgi:hypothetical protein